jgi:hypothetical protein
MMSREMAKKFGIKSNADQKTPGTRIKSAAELVPDGLLVFSFKYFAPDHPRYNASEAEIAYFSQFLGRMKEMCCFTMRSLMNRKSDAILRFHPTDFARPTVTADGFGIPQCSITRNEHGRVHGFVIETTFFVVWLDPGHQLDPGQQVTGN